MQSNINTYQRESLKLTRIITDEGTNKDLRIIKHEMRKILVEQEDKC